MMIKLKDLSDISWHTISPTEACGKLDCEIEKGLSEEEVNRRLDEFGRNELKEKPPRPAWKKFLDQFKSLLVGVLLGAAVLANAIGDIKDAIVILVVTIFNATLGFYQEHRAEQTLAALKNMLANEASVKRHGNVQNIEAPLLVPGDIVLLEAGDKIPADGRLFEAHNLEIAEAALTGESLPVGKKISRLEEDSLPLGDRSNMAFMNTVVTKGRAEMIVTNTGQRTEMGKIAGMISEAPESSTPLQKQLDTLGKKLAALAGFVVLVIFAIDFFRGEPLAQAAMKAVALAVAAVPEGLPAVVTVTLALGMWRMAKNKAIVKKLSSVETLGSTTVICSDKTGTLTMNKMSVQEAYFNGEVVSFEAIKNKDYTEHLRPMVLSSEASLRHGSVVGDPTEAALLGLALEGGLDPETERERYPRLAEIPFDSEHKFMATFHHHKDSVLMFIKGAPDVLLDHSKDHKHKEIENKNIEFAKKGLRVLAVAKRVIPSSEFEPHGDLWRWVGDWEFLGMAGIIDPPRPEALEAITDCKMAGIQVKMITGDHKITASTIAKKLGLEGDVVLGKEIDHMNEEELGKSAKHIAVFARVSPEHKVKIVKALKSQGNVTAMTGDGVNDAPALKSADIGVAMGITGTAVTKEAAKLILTDDNFATIVIAVKEGRVIYDNIVKFVRFQLSTNIGAILTVLGATLAGIPAPFTAIQLLWINIIMDGPPAMSLGVEKARDGLMSDPPRSEGAQILSLERITVLIFYGVVMMVGTLYVFNHGLKNHNEKYAVTMAFSTFVFFQFFNVFNARVERTTAFNHQFFHNLKLWASLLLVIALQFLTVYWTPAQELFNTTEIDFYDWPLIIGIASSVLLLEEIRKLVRS